MKYKEGTRVEVLKNWELPCGSWWRAQVISGDGHSYSVKYCTSPSGASEVVERVPEKAIRPCPPLLQGPISWVPGDVVEVFDHGSWKLAEVTSVVEGSSFFVRLLGSFGAFKVHESEIRPRQCWQDNRWVVIRKDVRNPDGGALLKHGCHQSLTCQKWRVQNCEESATEEAKWVLSKVKKRRFQCCLPSERCHRATKKLKSGDKEGRHHQMAAVDSHHLKKKVDAVSSPQNKFGENYMHASLNNRTAFSEVDEWGKLNDDAGYIFPRSLELSDSSVCSSSGSNELDVFCCHPSTGPCVDGDIMSDDGNSSHSSKVWKKQDLAVRIHNLEFHAYRVTMEALHSHGPITWEQEELMSNLRLELHISNDEHLSILRLIPSSESDLFSYI